jgi:SAM-dependent methyltransferase
MKTKKEELEGENDPWQNYFDEFASFYDHFYGELDEDLDFYMKIAEDVKGNVLEVGCGTGRILIGLASQGISMVGIDYSPRMVKICKERAKELTQGVPTTILVDDMRTMKLDQKFPLIILPFHAFLQLRTQEEQIKTLINLRDHLEEGGKLVINLFIPKVEILSKGATKFELVEGRAFKSPRGNNVNVYEKFNYDLLNQYIFWTQRLDEFNQKGNRIESQIFEGGLRYVWFTEFELLVQLAGFTKWEVYGDYEFEPLTEKSEEMNFILHKTPQ